MHVRRLALIPLLAILLLPGHAGAVGLGSIELHSALHQPLDAEIPLRGVDPDDVDRVNVMLASEQAFRNVGLRRPQFLSELQFDVRERPSGELYIAVTGRNPVSEPYLTFLIEVQAPTGNLLREYTALLDPPVYATEEAEPEVAVPEPAAEPEPEPEPRVAETEPEPAAEPEVEPAPAPDTEAVVRRRAFGDEPVFLRVERERETVHEERRLARVRAAEEAERAAALAAQQARREAEQPATHTTEAGDTAWEIASRHASGDTSVQQMMLALLRHNEDAFAEGNINRLRQGYVLRIPDDEDARSIDNREAIAQIREHNEVWQAWRDSLRATTVADAAEAEREREAMEADEREELRIVGAEDGAEVAGPDADATGVADAAELRATREQLEATRLEKEEMQSRVAELESTVERMEQLITLRNEQLEQLQTELRQIEARETETPAATEGDDDEGWLATILGMIAGIAGALGALAAGGLPGGLPGGPLPMAALAAVVLLLLAMLVYRRRQAAAASEAEEDLLAVDDVPPAPSEDDSYDDDDATRIAGQDNEEVVGVDESAADASVAATGSSDTAAGDAEVPASTEAAATDDAEAEDETLAEADVYLAYGLLDQAEELLRNALSENPDRQDYREKMLEALYSARKREAFESEAEKFRDAGIDSESPLWKRVVAMGREIAPDNPLFSGEGEADADALIPDRPEPPQAPDIELDAETSDEAEEDDDRSTRASAADDDNMMEFDLGDLDEITGESERQSTAPADDSETVDDLDAGGIDIELDGDETADDKHRAEASGDTDLAGGIDIELDDDETADDKDSAKASGETDPGDFEFSLDDLEPADTESADEIVAEPDSRKTPTPEDPDDLPDMDFTDEDSLLPEKDELTDADDSDEKTTASPMDFDFEESESPSAEDDDAEARKRTPETNADDDGAFDFDFDIGDLEDLEPDDSALADSTAPDLHMDEEDEGTSDDFADDEPQDYDTLIDLARAYIEMGDMDSARSTLDEVLADGDERQQQEARELLESVQ